MKNLSVHIWFVAVVLLLGLALDTLELQPSYSLELIKLKTPKPLSLKVHPIGIVNELD